MIGVHMPALTAFTVRASLTDSRIDCDLFTGIPNLIKLDLSECKIDVIYANAFEPIAHSLQLLNLEKNNLKHMPVGIFDGLRMLLVLKVNQNPWICSTELCEFQRYLIKYPEFAAGAECQTPFSGIPIDLAKDLCPAENCLVALKCFSTNDDFTINLNSPDTSMTIVTTAGDKQNVAVKFDAIPPINLSLMWFSDMFVNSAKIIDQTMNVEHLNLSTSYIFCLINMTLGKVLPLNCLAHYLDATPEIIQLPWLTSNDKRDTIGCFFGGIILSVIFGFIAGYLLIVRNPMLLKGSSKIIVIRNYDDHTSGASTTPFESISDWNRLSDLG